MRTWILDASDKTKRMEVLDDLFFDEGQALFFPEWGGKHTVTEVVFLADMQGGKCSLTQQVFVEPYAEEKR